MPGLTIAWEYLTGYYRATNLAVREQAEWPPHPARVFMALAAVWFETGEDAEEEKALRWLEALAKPELILPPSNAVYPRAVSHVYVPVNDKAGPSAAVLQSAPITRSKQPRTFPCHWVGDATCYLHWPNAPSRELQGHRSALGQLCAKVTRIGHSQSLVRMWVADEVPNASEHEVWREEENWPEFQTRRIVEGALEMLRRQFQLPYPNNRPKIGLWSGYRRKAEDAPLAIPHSHFDSDLIILTRATGQRLPLSATLKLTRALRSTLLQHFGANPVPDWISGHTAGGEPLRNGNGHLAIIPLSFVGHEHAEGQVLGLALVFPRSVSRQDRGRALGAWLLEPSGKPTSIMLTLGSLGIWTLQKRDWSEHRRTLTPETWTAHPNGATTWASVTPVVLDRFPKADPLEQGYAWRCKVAEIAAACERIGLPRPSAIDLDTTSWHRGSPRAVTKRRPLRGHSTTTTATASLGDGFPNYPAKGTNAPRPQVHVWLHFAEPVVGPILLGAGRFLGYGLCKPLQGDQEKPWLQ